MESPPQPYHRSRHQLGRPLLLSHYLDVEGMTCVLRTTFMRYAVLGPVHACELVVPIYADVRHASFDVHQTPSLE